MQFTDVDMRKSVGIEGAGFVIRITSLQEIHVLVGGIDVFERTFGGLEKFEAEVFVQEQADAFEKIGVVIQQHHLGGEIERVANADLVFHLIQSRGYSTAVMVVRTVSGSKCWHCRSSNSL